VRVFSTVLATIVFTGLTILARRGFRGYAQRSIQVKKQDDAPRESMSERIAAWLEEPYEPTGWPDAEWSLDRPVCPCCGCIASHGFVCDVCDWEEPLDSSGAPIASPDRDALLAKARESYEATGSVMSVEERASWGGLLTPREIELGSAFASAVRIFALAIAPTPLKFSRRSTACWKNCGRHHERVLVTGLGAFRKTEDPR